MTITIDTNDSIEIRRIGLKALNQALGAEGTKAFLKQYTCRKGDFTKEKYEHPQITFDEAIKAMRKVDKDEVNRAERKG
ncbi:MAG: hypothetical protein LBB56_05385 [Chitinispirillales bacterium]|jgi:hypothetical protein|nr:hypothetical protein [Chitinispirillales bacterium]